MNGAPAIAGCANDRFALRLGLRYARGLREDAAKTLIAAREQRVFTSVQDLALRVPELHKNELALLARIGALNSLGDVAHRRDALWQVEYAGRPAGPLLDSLSEELTAERETDDGAPLLPSFDRSGNGGEREHTSPLYPSASTTGALGTPLQPMTLEERLVADFSGTGVTVGKHPMARHRAELRRDGILSAAELPHLPHGRVVRVAGSVIARQRPGTAKGFVFLSLEDETGIANAILTPAIYEQHKHVVVYEKFLLIEGELQNQENVVSVKARSILPLRISEADIRSHDFH